MLLLSASALVIFIKARARAMEELPRPTDSAARTAAAEVVNSSEAPARQEPPTITIESAEPTASAAAPTHRKRARAPKQRPVVATKPKVETPPRPPVTK